MTTTSSRERGFMAIDQDALNKGYDAVAEILAFGEYRAAVLAYLSAKAESARTPTPSVGHADIVKRWKELNCDLTRYSGYPPSDHMGHAAYCGLTTENKRFIAERFFQETLIIAEAAVGKLTAPTPGKDVVEPWPSEQKIAAQTQRINDYLVLTNNDAFMQACKDYKYGKGNRQKIAEAVIAAMPIGQPKGDSLAGVATLIAELTALGEDMIDVTTKPPGRYKIVKLSECLSAIRRHLGGV